MTLFTHLVAEGAVSKKCLQRMFPLILCARKKPLNPILYYVDILSDRTCNDWQAEPHVLNELEAALCSLKRFIW